MIELITDDETSLEWRSHGLFTTLAATTWSVSALWKPSGTSGKYVSPDIFDGRSMEDKIRTIGLLHNGWRQLGHKTGASNLF
jgi:hypothetical protein